MSGFLGQDILSQIRSANDIVDVVQWLNVPLKKAGANFRALCPFHKEKTPSFNVSAQRQSFHCFGCGAGGDVFKFMMMREGLSFVESVRRLAERAHISIPDRAFTVSGPDRSHRDKLYELHVQVRDWMHSNLMRSRQAEGARAYLKKRRFTSETAKTFGLGYALNSWDGLIKWAKSQKIDLKLLEEAGLILSSGKGPYDRFRDRLMIPIADENGRVVGFSGRLLSNDAKEAKYVNSPETPIFKKGQLLFGLDRSKRAMQESKTAIVCEGQLDWIRCFEAGVRNMIAPQGTAFTEDHARILQRYVEKVILCFDSDSAGQKATWRNAEMLLPTGMSIRVVSMPSGEDPDSYISKFGPEAFQKLLEQAVDVFEFKTMALAKSLDMNDPKNHQKAFQEMMPLLVLIENEPQRKKLIQNICNILDLDQEAFLTEFQKQRRKFVKSSPFREPEQSISLKQNVFGETMNRLGDQLLQLVLNEKSVALFLLEQIEEKWFENYALKNVLFYILKRAREGEWKPGWDGLQIDLEEFERNGVARLLTQPLQMEHREMAILLQNAFIGIRRAYLSEKEKELLKSLKNPKISDKERLHYQTELLDLARQMKQI
jgi:DNA primase